MLKDILFKKRDIESEFEDTLYNVIRGFTEEDGYSVPALSSILEISQNSLRRYVMENGINPPEKTKHPMENHSGSGGMRSRGLRNRMKRQPRMRNGKPYRDNVSFGGKTKALIELAEMNDIKPNTLAKRIRRGWSVSRAIKEPVQPRKSG